MSEELLFQKATHDTHIDIFLGEWPCDIPFAGGELIRASLSLTDDSPKSHHHIPILRIHAGHQMDFEAHEQTPAGHAAMLVASWLNNNTVDEAVRYAAELFLWQWPGVRQLDDDSWHLKGLSTYQSYINENLINLQGQVVIQSLEELHEFQTPSLHISNLQVHPYGFCRKASPCFLLDACLLCPHFATNSHFTSSLQRRTHELQNKRIEAVLNHNHRLAKTCQQALINLESVLTALHCIASNQEGDIDE